MTEEMPVRETVAQKRAPQKQNLIYGCIIAALAVFAAASAVFNAKNGAGLVVFGILLAVLAGGFSAYCFALYFAQKKLPDVLIYAEGDGLFCYRHKEKDYERIPLSDIVSVEGGITAREVRAGLLRIRTAAKKAEITRSYGRLPRAKRSRNFVSRKGSARAAEMMKCERRRNGRPQENLAGGAHFLVKYIKLRYNRDENKNTTEKMQ